MSKYIILGSKSKIYTTSDKRNKFSFIEILN